MALPTAVADTSVLIALHHLELLPKLSIFFHRVLVPASVRLEFLRMDDVRTREAALGLLIAGEIFAPCDDYDTVQVNLYLLEKLQRAEAEALSQTKLTSATYLLIDEKRGRRIAIRERQAVRGTARILADLHLLGLANYTVSLKQLESELGFRISETVAHAAMRDARAEMGKV